MLKKKIKYSKDEFEMAYLPKNRKEVFKDILKQRFDVFLKLGLMIFIFLMPIITLFFLVDMAIYNLTVEYQNEVITEKIFLETLFVLKMYKDIGVVVFSALIAIFISITFEIIKKLVWYEPIFFVNDAIKSLKNNFKQIFITTLIMSIFYFLGNSVSNILVTDPILNVLKYIPFGLTVIVFIPIGLYVMMQSIIYKENIVGHFKNAFILYVLTFLKTIMNYILLILPIVLINFINGLVFTYLILIVFIIVYLPIWMASWQLHTHEVFDFYINKKSYPELYKKGIYNKGDYKNEN